MVNVKQEAGAAGQQQQEAAAVAGEGRPQQIVYVQATTDAQGNQSYQYLYPAAPEVRPWQ